MKTVFEIFRPALNSDAVKELNTLNALMDLFPDKSLSEIKKEVDKLLKNAPIDISVLVNKLSRKVAGNNDESIDQLIQETNKLKIDDLKKIMQELQLHAGSKKELILNDLRSWLVSNGEIKPIPLSNKTTKKVDKFDANAFNSQVKQLFEEVTQESADEICRMIDNHYSKLKVSDIKNLALTLDYGLTEKKKDKMIGEIKNMIQRRVMTHIQSEFV